MLTYLFRFHTSFSTKLSESPEGRLGFERLAKTWSQSNGIGQTARRTGRTSALWEDIHVSSA